MNGGVRKKGVAIAEKKHAYEVWLQKKDEVSYEYHEVQSNRLRRVVCDTQVNADRRWDSELTVNFQENKISSGRR